MNSILNPKYDDDLFLPSSYPDTYCLSYSRDQSVVKWSEINILEAYYVWSFTKSYYVIYFLSGVSPGA